jgi:hypothetical protein
MERMELMKCSLPTNPCEGCAIRKNVRRPFPKQHLSPQVKKACFFFHADVYGYMNQESFGKDKFFVLFKDDFSNIVLYIVRDTNLTCWEHLKAFCTIVLQQARN